MAADDETRADPRRRQVGSTADVRDGPAGASLQAADDEWEITAVETNSDADGKGGYWEESTRLADQSDLNLPNSGNPFDEPAKDALPNSQGPTGTDVLASGGPLGEPEKTADPDKTLFAWDGMPAKQTDQKAPVSPEAAAKGDVAAPIELGASPNASGGDEPAPEPSSAVPPTVSSNTFSAAWSAADSADAKNDWLVEPSHTSVSAPEPSGQAGVTTVSLAKALPGDGPAMGAFCFQGETEAFSDITFKLSSDESSVGRSSSNQLVLEHPSVSRFHAVLRVSSGGVLVIDQGSNNGTFVNGEKVDSRSLKSGDQVAFGTVVFRFSQSEAERATRLDTDSPTPGDDALGAEGRTRHADPNRPAPARRKRHTVQLLLSLLLLLGSGAFTAFLAHDLFKQREGQSDRVFEYYLSGIESFKQRDWEMARRQFVIYLGHVPDHLRSKQYLQTISDEQAAAVDLATATRLFKKGDAATAKAKLQNPLSSIFLAEEAALLLAQVEKVLLVAEQKAASESKSSLSPKKESSAKSQPQPKAPIKVPDDQRAGTSSAPKSSSKSSGVDQIARARALFISGDSKATLRALGKLRGVREAARMARRVSQFQKAYNQGRRAYRAQQPKTAILHLQKALDLEHELAGGDSAFADDMRHKQADMYYVQGLASYRGERFGDAFRHASEATRVWPKHRAANRLLGDLRAAAEQIYREGYEKRQSDPEYARDRWQLVLQIVAPGSDLYQKASRRLEKQ